MAKRVKIWRCSNCRHDYCARDERHSCPNCWAECKQERVKATSNSRPIRGDINAWIARLDTVNVAAARIIAADRARYPGLPQRWAHLILSRRHREQIRKEQP